MAMIRLRSSAVSRPQFSTSASRPVESASDSASSCVLSVVFPERYVVGSSPTGPTSILILGFQYGSLFIGCLISTPGSGNVRRFVRRTARICLLRPLERLPNGVSGSLSVGPDIEPQRCFNRFMPHHHHEVCGCQEGSPSDSEGPAEVMRGCVLHYGRVFGVNMHLHPCGLSDHGDDL